MQLFSLAEVRTMGRMMMFALAAAGLLLSGCPGGDACMEFCEISVACNSDEGSAEWVEDVDACYAEYENQGLGTAALDASWKATCQTSIDNWPGCNL
jgi:hypothetical protein